jgi:hypothetical protein
VRQRIKIIPHDVPPGGNAFHHGRAPAHVWIKDKFTRL